MRNWSVSVGEGPEWNRPYEWECGVGIRLEKMLTNISSVLHLLKEFVGRILIAVLLHPGQMTLLWCHCCIHLPTQINEVSKTKKNQCRQRNTLGNNDFCIVFNTNHLFIKAFLYLNYTMMNRGILLLPQHHQGNDNDSCYNNTSDHKSNDGTFIGPHILSEKHLPLKTKVLMYPNHRPV